LVVSLAIFFAALVRVVFFLGVVVVGVVLEEEEAVDRDCIYHFNAAAAS